MSQKALGERVGVNKDQVGRWEKGTNIPGVDKFDAYARAVHAPIDRAMDLVRDKTATRIKGLRVAVELLMQEGLTEKEIARISAWQAAHGDQAIREALAPELDGE